jgi:predicted CopG family antitoxin
MIKMKTIKIEDKVWGQLIQLKYAHRFATVSEVIKVLLEGDLAI